MAKYVDMLVSEEGRTERASKLVFYEDTKEQQTIWVPLSVILDETALDKVDERGLSTVTIAKWFLIKNGIEYNHEGYFEDDEDEDDGPEDREYLRNHPFRNER